MSNRRNTLGKVGTTVYRDGEWTVVKYHNTEIVRFNSFTIQLQHGGWVTPTTVVRMNQASNQFGLSYRVSKQGAKRVRKQWGEKPSRDTCGRMCVSFAGKCFTIPHDGVLTLTIPPAESPDWRPNETIPEDYYAA